jgi:hypothetical protein
MEEDILFAFVFCDETIAFFTKECNNPVFTASSASIGQHPAVCHPD